MSLTIYIHHEILFKFYQLPRPKQKEIRKKASQMVTEEVKLNEKTDN